MEQNNQKFNFMNPCILHFYFEIDTDLAILDTNMNHCYCSIKYRSHNINQFYIEQFLYSFAVNLILSQFDLNYFLLVLDTKHLILRNRNNLKYNMIQVSNIIFLLGNHHFRQMHSKLLLSIHSNTNNLIAQINQLYLN